MRCLKDHRAANLRPRGEFCHLRNLILPGCFQSLIFSFQGCHARCPLTLPPFGLHKLLFDCALICNLGCRAGSWLLNFASWSGSHCFAKTSSYQLTIKLSFFPKADQAAQPMAVKHSPVTLARGPSCYKLCKSKQILTINLSCP